MRWLYVLGYCKGRDIETTVQYQIVIMQNVTSDILREALDAALTSFHQRLRGGRLTADDLDAILKIFASAGGISVTVSDLADLYGQSETNVRSVIKRRIAAHPKRRVYYNLLDFIRVAPRKWHINPRPSRPSE